MNSGQSIDKGMIKVPEISWLKPEQEVKVILLAEDFAESEGQDNSDLNFKAVKIKTKGFRFNREEAHERQNIY
ncbi:MAG: hypothetical protein GY795_46455 [Desulfobacterales bacterium]|nr:hypothetical protein [Desulfobacterales bacterium]